MKHVDINLNELPMSDVISSVKQNFIEKINIVFELLYVER